MDLPQRRKSGEIFCWSQWTDSSLAKIALLVYTILYGIQRTSRLLRYWRSPKEGRYTEHIGEPEMTSARHNDCQDQYTGNHPMASGLQGSVCSSARSGEALDLPSRDQTSHEWATPSAPQQSSGNHEVREISRGSSMVELGTWCR